MGAKLPFPFSSSSRFCCARGFHKRNRIQMLQILRKMFDTSDKDVKMVLPIAEAINALEPEMEALSDAGLREKSDELRSLVQGGASLESVMTEAYALVRETSK